MHPPPSHRPTLLLTAVIITLWAIAGLIMSRGQGYSDAFYGPDYIMQSVIPGGPGQAAGFHVGDRVVTVENIPVEGLGMQSRWPRVLEPRLGQSHRFVVERGGELVTLTVTYGPTPQSVLLLRLGAALVGLAFLWCGVWALFTVGTPHAQRLAYIGLAAGVAMTGMGPSLGRWNGVASHIQFAALILWAALLLRFFLSFPTMKRAGTSTLATRIIYGAWLVFLPVLVVELIVHPTLYHSYAGPGYLLMLSYLILALVAVAHTAVTNPWWKLKQSGMSLILTGLLVGIVPTLVGVADWALMRDFHIPGSVYWPMLIAVIPLTIAMGVRREAQGVRRKE